MVFEQIQTQLKNQPKTWLITGVAGFIGSNLLEALVKLNERGVGLDNFSRGFEHNLNEVRKMVSAEQWRSFRLIDGDICELATCHYACTGIDYVLHHAAHGSVTRSIENPITSNKNNINGFLNMLVAARDMKVQRFIYAASSSTYGDHPALPKVEGNIGRPLSPYAVTKLVNELYAEVFARTYGFKSIGLRYFNVFGRRQNPEGAYAAVIPKWITSIIEELPICINGDGETSRDFCYIENVIQANMLAAVNKDNASNNQIYNVSVGDRTSLNDLYYFMRELILLRLPQLEVHPPIYRDFRVGDVRHSVANIEKIKTSLGYQPTHTVKQGLNDAVDWYIASISK